MAGLDQAKPGLNINVLWVYGGLNLASCRIFHHDTFSSGLVYPSGHGNGKDITSVAQFFSRVAGAEEVKETRCAAGWCGP